MDDNYKYKSLVDFLQDAVDKIAKDYWKEDTCPPEFIVSVLYQNNMHTIVLTVNHLGKNLSETIFPDFEMKYGYESLADRMKWLYNRTM